MGLGELLGSVSGLSLDEHLQAHLKEVTEESEVSNQGNWRQAQLKISLPTSSLQPEDNKSSGVGK